MPGDAQRPYRLRWNGEEALEPLARVIGSYRAKAPGPLVFCIGGMHGNELAGIHACRRVLRILERRRPDFKGEWLALAGNIPALNRNCRFIDEDLNRIWLTERIQAQAAGVVPHDSIESREQNELLSQVEAALSRNPAETYFVDLHTTSAAGPPFSVFADTLHNRRLAENLPGSMVLGLEEHLEGTLLNYANYLGHVAVGFEAGQHASPNSAEIHEVAIWRTLTLAGCLDYRLVPEAAEVAAKVRMRMGRHPRVVEIRYRHGVNVSDEFVMESGFENMRRVEKGRLMARDRKGEIRALYGGRVLMPLYQSQGSDGFFIVRDLHWIWLLISTVMRKLRLGRLMAHLPGVERHPTLDDTLIVHWRIRRWLVVDVFHLLGYRKRRVEKDALVMQWRRETPGP